MLGRVRDKIAACRQVTPELRQALNSAIDGAHIDDTDQSVAGQNHVLYQCVGTIKRLPLPEEFTALLVQALGMYDLAVPVSLQTVIKSMRPNRNKPVVISPDEE